MGVSSDLEIRFREWMRKNRDIWEDRFVAPALYEAAHNRRISVQRLMEDVRAKDYVNWQGEPVKVNNSYAPLFARELINDHPELGDFIETRKSIFDKPEADHGAA